MSFLIFMFFVHHGRKIAQVLNIYPASGTENNTEHILLKNWHCDLCKRGPM